jgi:hypothetical protein
MKQWLLNLRRKIPRSSAGRERAVANHNSLSDGGFTAPAYGETPQNVPGTNVEGSHHDNNVGALTAPEANKGSTIMSGQGGMSADSAGDGFGR